MKTLKERLDDLNKSLKEAKTLEEAQKISQEIEDISADAVKVSEALEKANTEAKDSREKSDKLETENEELKKNQKTKKTYEKETEEEKKARLEAEKNETPPWAKTLIEKSDNLNTRLDTIEKKDKSEELSVKIKEALKEANIPEKFAQYIKVEDAEKIKDAVDTLKQSLNDEELKENFPLKKGDGEGSVAVDTVKEFAKSENESSSTEITGKELTKTGE